MERLKLPKFGQTMEEADLLQWFVSEGDQFNVGDELYEVETEKSSVTVEATIAGQLARIVVPAGAHIEVGTTVAVAVSEGETAEAAAIDTFLSGAPPETSIAEAAEAAETVEVAAVDAAAVTSGASRERARRPVDGVHRQMARVMAASWSETPQFQQTCLVDATALLAARTQLNADGDTAARISLNDVLLQRVAAAVAEVPAVNASFADDVIVEYADVDVAIAVSTERGLLAPVVRRAQEMSIAALAAETRRLAVAAAAGTLTPDDLSGATITFSNLGMFGVDSGFALVTKPQAAIVFAGSIAARPMVIDGRIEARQTVNISVTYDHRVVDGATAATFLSALKRLIEG